MNRLALVVGMGIGQLYKQQLEILGYDVVTVDPDPNKAATYLNLDSALAQNYDVAHICTPNFTHEELAYRVAERSNIVFVEKPGLQTEQRWRNLINTFPYKRITMVKNNQWRPWIAEWQAMLPVTRLIRLNWINHDRVPSPGSWFTQRQYAWGGVSRDLLPHLLSIVAAVVPDYESLMPSGSMRSQNWRLSDLTSTDYGSINPQGVYDVDDFVHVAFERPDYNIDITADWRSLDDDNVQVSFYTAGIISRFDLGLCPDYVYGNMIKDCVDHFNDDAFWYRQQQCDLWIHKIIDELK